MSNRRFLPHAVLAFAAAWAFIAATFVAIVLPLPDGPDDYNSPGFVVRQAGMKFAYLAAAPFHDSLSEAEQDEKVRRFFELNGLIRDRERVAGDAGTPATEGQAALDELTSLRDERAGIENTVEAILNGRLTALIEDVGLTRDFGRKVVWPPVSVEFEDPPALLVTSPREQIRRESQTLLDGNLPIERVQHIEADAERDGRTSALVVGIGGIAMYPAIVPPGADYHATLQDVAHEWTHHYLYFTPLGRNYYRGPELTTLNETLANMAGRELGDLLFQRYPLERTVTLAPLGAPPAARGADIDFVAEMRGLRREVEALLADGRVEEAERRMEEKREFLAVNGYYIRRLNQAYFAFHGSYADTAGSIDPIGPKFDELRRESASLRDFVRKAQELTSAADLNRALGATP